MVRKLWDHQTEATKVYLKHLSILELEPSCATRVMHEAPGPKAAKPAQEAPPGSHIRQATQRKVDDRIQDEHACLMQLSCHLVP